MSPEVDTPSPDQIGIPDDWYAFCAGVEDDQVYDRLRTHSLASRYPDGILRHLSRMVIERRRKEELVAELEALADLLRGQIGYTIVARHDNLVALRLDDLPGYPGAPGQGTGGTP